MALAVCSCVSFIVWEGEGGGGEEHKKMESSNMTNIILPYISIKTSATILPTHPTTTSATKIHPSTPPHSLNPVEGT